MGRRTRSEFRTINARSVGHARICWTAHPSKPPNTAGMQILVIEDEKKTAAFLAKGLREAGFEVETAADGELGVEMARATPHDLLIVDIMLPKKDGWTVVKE